MTTRGLAGLIAVLAIVGLAIGVSVYRRGDGVKDGSGAEYTATEAEAASPRDDVTEEAPGGAVMPEEASPAGPGGGSAKGDEDEGSAAVEEGLRLYREGKLAEANRVLTESLDEAGAREEEVYETLRKLGKDLFLDPTVFDHLTFHTVRRGDNLWELSRRYKTTVGMLKRVNGLRTDRIDLGQRLAIPPKGATILISKRKFRLTFLVGPYYVTHYPIGIGKLEKTPEASFQVTVKLENPDWYPEGGGVVKHGDPNNPLGSRWMGFEGDGGHSGLGIHGTSDEESIGQKRSRGCIRMRKRDVEELYEMVPLGTRVVIEE